MSSAVTGNSQAARAATLRAIGSVSVVPAMVTIADQKDARPLPLVYVGVGRADRLRRASDALDRVGLVDRKDHAPNQLSGGEQQRVTIARAIISDPALILADEPTGALDSHTAGEIMTLFEELHRDGCTIVVVTHAPDVAARARRRIVLDDGRIVSDDVMPSRQAAVAIAMTGRARL